MEPQLATQVPANPTSMAVIFDSANDIIPLKVHTLRSGRSNSYVLNKKTYTTALDEFENTLEYKNESSQIIKQIEILHKFSSKIIHNLKDLDPVIAKEVNDKLWDII